MANEVKAIVPRFKQLQITWAVSNLCNYRCSYCTEDLWRGDQRSPHVSQYLKAFEQIFLHYRDRGFERLHLVLTGGEPTFWQPLGGVLEHLRREASHHFERVTFSITTNLSHSLAWWKQHYDLFTDVMASYHVERAQPENFLTILEFLEDKCFLNIHLMMHEEQFDKLIELGEEIKMRLRNYSLDYVPLLESLSSSAPAYQYRDPHHMEFLRRHASPIKSYGRPMSRPLSYEAGVVVRRADGRETELYPNALVSAGENFFKGWKCHLDELIMINPDGSAQYGTCGAGRRLGNINNGELELSEQVLRCPHHQCYCGSDILIRKEVSRPWFSFRRDLPPSF